ncbi:hydrolase [Thermopolyspora flexuosa]|uniref:Pimeloyl-ACP methyl ester carboxylesterase n=1 Tax=Thermopolyspora flexuosa TaxID=103836 RepID=A0A543IY61_9ACTN|nr:alpha/beta hydrolase [Thermopolyspora flexuosa]TQM75515.1 pimeloyl-ACP methyl ester carboxylesterase [Thermopolyspora flexuosa]GGM60014.1 hydrolase [Thermopolyspora flexuosa]
MTEPKTHTLEVPGAVLQYDVREGAGDGEPPLLMIGSPMDATGFVSLAARFPERTVVTYDPRGTGRSARTDATVPSPPIHADDLSRVIAAVGGGPVDVFASSGGAVNALALAAHHPGAVRTVVAHEPPLLTLLPDRERALAAVGHIRRVYERDGLGAGMACFIALTSIQGEIPADFAELPMPDPAAFGFPPGDDGSRDDPLLGQNLITCTHYEPDFEALRAAPARVVFGVGVESAGQLTYRAAVAAAERLGAEPVEFPGGHAGFLGGEYGVQGDPDGFAAVLRRVLGQG